MPNLTQNTPQFITGVMIGVPKATPELRQTLDQLSRRLEPEGVAVLRCDDGHIKRIPELVARFLSDKKLKRVLIITDTSNASVIEALRSSTEQAGLQRLAVIYLDIKLLGHGCDIGYALVMTNLARLEHADYIDDVVFRSAIGPMRISRRQLLRAVPHALRVESDIPVILQSRCNHRSESCTHCKDACPVNAISLTRESVVIEERLCVECGACARECPVGAIQCPSISDTQITAMLNALMDKELEPNNQTLMLTCPIGFQKLRAENERSTHLENGIVPVQIPCVAAVGAIHYLWSASHGIALITVCPDSSCKKSMATFPMHEHVSSSKTALTTLAGSDLPIVEHLSLRAEDSLIESISRVVTSVSPSDMVGALPNGLRRDLTLEALRRLRAHRSKPETLLSSNSKLPIFDLKVDIERCTFCELCQGVCPEGAIEFTKTEASSSMMLATVLCGGCMICEKTCPVQAISLTRLTELRSFLEGTKLECARDEVAKCENCGTVLGTKQSFVGLRKRLSEQGVSDLVLRGLSYCNKCKEYAVYQQLEAKNRKVGS